MAKTKKWIDPTYCAYCGKWTDKPEDEHPFPSSWYPESVPYAQKVSVPACEDCNRPSSGLEERLRRLFAFCTEHPLADSARQSAFRSIQPYGKDETGAKHAIAKLESLKRAKIVILPEDSNSILPSKISSSFEWIEQKGLWVNAARGFQFSPDDLDTLIKKMVRGFFFHEYKRPLPQNVPIKAYWGQSNEQVILALIQHDRANVRAIPSADFPVLEYAWQVVPDNPETGYWIFYVWGRFIFRGIVGELAE